MSVKVNSILAALQKHAKDTPEKLCVGDKKKMLTYEQFWDAVQKGAQNLLDYGLQKDDVIVVRAVQKVEFLTALMSIQLAGAIFCPIEKGIKDGRILEIMNDVMASYYLAEKPAADGSIVNISLKEFHKKTLEPGSGKSVVALPEKENIADILFTTGTTGKSKGIVVTHKSNVAIAENVMDSVEISKNEIDLITTPINHSLALRRFYGAMLNGSTAVLTDGFVFVEDFFKLIENYKITAITLVPAILDMILRFSQERLAAYNEQLNYIQLGSAPLSEEDKEILRGLLPDVRLYNTYGATESGCTVILDFNRYTNKKNCIGRTTVNTEILFVDKDGSKMEASEENPGLLVFQGDMNMKKYWGEPELTKEVLKNGCIYTNDIGYQGEDGLIYLLGRQGDVINLGGLKIAPSEIEEVVNSFDCIADSACIPISVDLIGEVPKLYVVMKDGYVFESAKISKLMSEKLENFKVPKYIEEIECIPRTFNGKIIRNQLKILNEASK